MVLVFFLSSWIFFWVLQLQKASVNIFKLSCVVLCYTLSGETIQLVGT